MQRSRNITKRQIMWGDLDPLGIVFYPRYYEWIDASAHLFFQSLNIDLGSLLEKRGIIFALLETGCKYHLAGRYNELIEIDTYIDDLSDKTVLLRHTISRSNDRRLLLEAFEKRICLNVSNQVKLRAIEMPKDIKKILSEAHSAC